MTALAAVVTLAAFAVTVAVDGVCGWCLLVFVIAEVFELGLAAVAAEERQDPSSSDPGSPA